MHKFEADPLPSEAEQSEAAAESLIARLADEFLERLDRGESPDIEEFIARWPGDARILRQTFASLKLARLSSVAAVADEARSKADRAQQLGDFRLLGELGRGGMGVVYEAEQVSLGRRVALKILPFAAVLDPRQLQRFKNEALAAAQLNHPNIVDVIAVGCEHGVHFYAMRLVDGPTLAQVIAELRQASGTRERAGKVNQSERSGDERRQAAGVRRKETDDQCRIHNTNCKLQTDPSGGDDEAKEVTVQTQDLSPNAPDLIPKIFDPNPQSKIQNRESTVPGLSTESPPEYYRCVARIVADVVLALDHAHQLSIVHRDVKPSNILLDARGKPWVTDFGLARLETGGELTMTGDLLGTLRYMNPEQAGGDRRLVDHRTDIYSLGATLYELLTLRPAFDAAERSKLLRSIALDPPRSPRKSAKTLPVELETIVLKTLEKNPADRYPTAGKLADDLQRFLDHRPIQARRSRLLAHAKSLWRRHQVLFMAVLTTLLIASMIASVLVWRQRQEAVAQRVLVIEREADLRQRLYAADMKQAHQAWQRGDVARAQELLDRYAGPAGDDVREFAWHYLSSLLSARPTPLMVLRPEHRSIYCVRFSPDGALLAAACGDGHVQLWNVADWSPRHTLKAHQADADCVAFSPDGKLLASGGEDGWLRLWNTDTGELTRSVNARQKETLTIAISPDGRTLAAGGIDGVIRFWPLPEGELRGEYQASNGRVQHLAFSPDGTKLATAGGDGNAMVADATSGTPLFLLPSQSMAAYAVAYSANGDRLALGSGSGLVGLIDTARGVSEHQFGTRADQVRSVGFSPTSPRLASAGRAGVVDLWDTRTRSLCAKLYGHERRIWSVSFSPDGKLLASAGDDGSVHIWDPNVDAGVVHAEHVESIYHVQFGPDGRGILAADIKQDLAIRDTTLHHLSSRKLPSEHANDLAFSPDRRKLAVRTSEGEIWLGDSLTGDFTRFDPGLSDKPVKIAMGSGGRLILWYRDSTMDVWHTDTPALLDRRKIRYVPGNWPAAISRDGGLMAVCCGKILFLYDMTALCPRFERLYEPVEIYSIALSPDAQQIAAGMAEGSLAFFDTTTGQRTAVLAGDQHWIDALAFSADGRTLATGGRGGAVRLWNVATREELFVLHWLDSNSSVVLDFSLDGRSLTVATSYRAAHGQLYLWTPSPAP